MKTAIYIGIIIIIGLLTLIFIQHQTGSEQKEQIKQLEGLYSSTKVENDSIKRQNKQLSYKYNTLETISQAQTVKIDSLDRQIYIDRNKPCDHQLRLQKELTDQLKYSLKICVEQKGIQTVHISNLATINVNNEVVMSECLNVIKQVERKDKKRKVLQWVERGGWVLLIAIILL